MHMQYKLLLFLTFSCRFLRQIWSFSMTPTEKKKSFKFLSVDRSTMGHNVWKCYTSRVSPKNIVFQAIVVYYVEFHYLNWVFKTWFKQDWESNLRPRVDCFKIKLRPCQDHVFQVHVCLDHVCQDHVLRPCLSRPCQFDPIRSNVIQFDPI